MVEAERKGPRKVRPFFINLSLAAVFTVISGYSWWEAVNLPDEGLRHTQRVLARQASSLEQILKETPDGFRQQQLERVQWQQSKTDNAIWEQDVRERGRVEAIRRSWGGLVLAPTLAGIFAVNAVNALVAGWRPAKKRRLV